MLGVFKMKKYLIAAAFAAAALSAVPGSAAVTICTTPNCAGANNNVNLASGQSASTVTGTFTGGTLSFTSNEVLETPSAGVARIDALVDPIDTLLRLQSSIVLSGLEFNLTAATSGNVLFTLIGGTLDGERIFGVTTSGQNKFGLSGGTFTGVTIDFGNSADFLTGGGTNGARIQDIRQVSVNTSAVPEPTTWAFMLVGFGAVGHSMRRRKVSYLGMQTQAV
jgi:opacity protein-like surface antigen